MTTRSNTILTGVLERAGTDIHYRVEGDNRAPLVVCTHGASLDAGAFEPNTAALVSAGYRVLVWDLPGHGDSHPMHDTFSIESAAQDLLALLDMLKADRVALMGQSFGGLVAQQLQLDQSDRVAAMVMIGATDLRVPLSRGQAMIQRLRPILLRAWPDAHLRRTFATMMAKQPQARLYAEHASQRQSKRDLIAVTRAALAGVLNGRSATRVPVPILVLYGEHELSMVVKAARSWVEREPQCRRVAIPGAGHLANLDAPERCNDLIVTFLNEHFPARPDIV